MNLQIQPSQSWGKDEDMVYGSRYFQIKKKG